MASTQPRRCRPELAATTGLLTDQQPIGSGEKTEPNQIALEAESVSVSLPSCAVRKAALCVMRGVGSTMRQATMSIASLDASSGPV